MPRKKQPRLYAAYGSNLSIHAMAMRCPQARPVGSSVITDARLVFRSVADIERHTGSLTPIGLWEITPDCERALDLYEGVSSGLYVKRVVGFDDGRQALVYVMQRGGILPPHARYFETIKAGYGDFGLDLKHLERARRHAQRYRKPTADVLQHHARRATMERKHHV
jgi:hypothetical protein